MRAARLAGDRSRLPFALLVEIRSLLGPGFVHAGVAVLSISLAVAMATGLEMTTRSVSHALDRIAEARAGSADLEIANGTLGVPEALIDEIAGVPGVKTAAPVIERNFWLTDSRTSGEALHVLGIDFLADRGMRDLQVSDGTRIVDPLQLVADTDSLIIAASLVERTGVTIGGTLRVRHERGTHALVVRGVLAPGGLADAYNGQVALMDVFALQALAAQPGVVDRIEVALAPNADGAKLTSRLNALVAGRASVSRPNRPNNELESAVATLQVGAGTFVLISIVIAALVSYGAASTSIQRRIPEIALLRAAGLEGLGVQQLVWIDCLLIAVLGTAIGFGLGLVTSLAFTDAFRRVIQFHESSSLEVLGPAPETFVIGALVGLVVSIVGVSGPARRASRVAPLDLLDSVRPHMKDRPRRAGVVLGVSGAAVAFVLALFPLGLSSAPRVTLIVVAGLFVLAIVVSPALRYAVRKLANPLERIAPSVGQLVGVSAIGRLAAVRIAAVAIAGVVAGVTLVFCVVGSMAGTMDAWGHKFWGDAIYVMVGNEMKELRELLSHDTVRRIRETPGVETLQESFPTDAMFRGEQVYLLAISSSSWVERRREDWVEGDPREVTLALEHGGVAISRAFASHFGVERGDSIELATPDGPRSFSVGGVFKDISREPGGVVLDVRQFDRHWPRPGAWRVAVWSSLPAEELIARIRDSVGERQPLLFVHGERLRGYGTEMVRPYLGLLWLSASLMCALGGISVMAAQLGVVVDRRRELALLRAAGATPRQILVLVLLDSVVVAAFAAVVGAALGLVSAWPGLGIFGETFHVNLGYHVDLRSTPMLALGAIVAAVLGALYPAWRAARVRPTEALTRE